MFKYLMIEIQEKVYKENKVNRKSLSAAWKEMNHKEKFLFVLLWLLSVAFIISSFHKGMISLVVFAAEVLVVIYIKSYEEKREKDMVKELRERYEKEELKRLKRLLKQPEWKLWNKKGIQWIIQECDMKIQEKGIIDNIKPFVWITFSAIVMPLVLLFLENLVEDMKKETLYLFMGIVFILVVLAISVGFIVYTFIIIRKDCHQNIYRRVRGDVQYLAAGLKK